MRIVATGRYGQVASCLREAATEGCEVILLGRPDLDLSDPNSVRNSIRAASPDLVVSAAAYTAVDKAEDEPELAHAINAVGAAAVAEAAAAAQVPVVHLSTDYVFAGEGSKPYTEHDETIPCSVYGRTKLEGEQGVASSNPDHVILRTAWVYSPYGKNFVKTILALAQTRDEIAVVSDQWGNPTSAGDIAAAVLHIATTIVGGGNHFGIFHLAGSGSTNWCGFAELVLGISARLGGPTARIRPITTDEYPTKARRPSNSRLATDAFCETYDWSVPSWQESSEKVVRRILRG